MSDKEPALGKGVRQLTLEDQLPDAEIIINKPAYTFEEVVKGKKVADIGCGYGRNRSIVERLGGEWIGVEPFEGGNHTVVASAEDLPFEDNSFDVVVMDAVLEHIPDVGKAFSEIGRILKPGGVFIGYVAFMETFHEISYSHLSFKALEHYSDINGLKLEKISGGRRFGIDYHRKVLLYPIPFQFLRGFVAWRIRTFILLKSNMAYVALRFKRRMAKKAAKQTAHQYYQLEVLRMSVGFSYLIRKK